MDKELLLKLRLVEEPLDLDGVGTIRLRGLSRREVVEAREACTLDGDELDQDRYEDELVARSMVDPVLTAAEVREWSRVAPAGELVRVMDAVRRLSAMGEEAAKSGVPGNRRERRAAVRARPGRATRKDA